MKILFAVLLLTTVASSAKLDWRIVGGQDASQGQFPYQVSVRYLREHLCGGAIINKDWVLTAAHCLLENIWPVTVVTGSTNQYEGTEYKTVYQIFHPKYNLRTLENDIGIIKVRTPILFNDYVQPIPMNTEDILPGSMLTISGWGLTSTNGVSPKQLQFIKLKLISNTECEKAYSPMNLEIFDSLVCTFTKKNEGNCHGDSGGPLVYNDKVVGVVSWGSTTGCADGYPDVYTRVSSFIPWIQQKMDECANNNCIG